MGTCKLLPAPTARISFTDAHFTDAMYGVAYRSGECEDQRRGYTYRDPEWCCMAEGQRPWQANGNVCRVSAAWCDFGWRLIRSREMSELWMYDWRPFFPVR